MAADNTKQYAGAAVTLSLPKGTLSLPKGSLPRMSKYYLTAMPPSTVLVPRPLRMTMA